MKKAWIFLLALVLMMFVSAQAEMKQCGDYYYTVLEDGTIEITVYTGEESELVIPSELDGYKVTAIGDFAFQSTDLEFLTIPEGIQRIGVNPFKDCYYLEKIAVAPGNPRFEVRSNALIDTVDQVLICYPNDAEIDAYQIPDGVVAVGGYAFVEHYPTSVVFPESCREIGPHAFDYCLDLEKVVMQGGVENIGESAFQDCIDLREVQFSSNLKVIGQNAFLNCSDLTIALLPEGLVEIGTFAFADCRNLRLINLPDSLKTLRGNPFRRNNGMELVLSPNHAVFEIVDQVLFHKAEKQLVCVLPSCVMPEGYEVPEGTKSIGDYAFTGAYIMGKVIIPESVEKMGANPFFRCFCEVKLASENGPFRLIDDALYDMNEKRLIACLNPWAKNLTVPEGIEVIGDSAGEVNVETLSLPSTLKTIGNNNFSLSQISYALPEGLVEIGSNTLDRGFSGPGALRIPASLERIGEFSLRGSELIEVYEGSAGHRYALINSGDIDFALIEESEES